MLDLDHEAFAQAFTNPPKYVTVNGRWVGFHNEDPELVDGDWVPAPYIKVLLPACLIAKNGVKIRYKNSN